jgi:hypothetical protein
VNSACVVAPQITVARRRRRKKVVVARATAKRGTTNPRVSAAERSGTDYHISGEGLLQN